MHVLRVGRAAGPPFRGPLARHPPHVSKRKTFVFRLRRLRGRGYSSVPTSPRKDSTDELQAFRCTPCTIAVDPHRIRRRKRNDRRGDDREALRHMGRRSRGNGSYGQAGRRLLQVRQRQMGRVDANPLRPHELRLVRDARRAVRGARARNPRSLGRGEDAEGRHGRGQGRRALSHVPRRADCREARCETDRAVSRCGEESEDTRRRRALHGPLGDFVRPRVLRRVRRRRRKESRQVHAVRSAGRHRPARS